MPQFRAAGDALDDALVALTSLRRVPTINGNGRIYSIHMLRIRFEYADH